MAAASELRPDSGVNRTVKWFYWICNFESAEAAVTIVKKLILPFQFILLIWFLQIIEKLSVSAPSGEARLKVLKEIAQEYNLNWDSSNTEAEFSRKHEDLLVQSE